MGVVPLCVTVTTTGLNPATVTVRLASLVVMVVFSVNEAVIVPFPLPDKVGVHQAASLNTVQGELDVTAKLVLPAA